MTLLVTLTLTGMGRQASPLKMQVFPVSFTLTVLGNSVRPYNCKRLP